jgi:hypothetical protein
VNPANSGRREGGRDAGTPTITYAELQTQLKALGPFRPERGGAGLAWVSGRGGPRGTPQASRLPCASCATADGWHTWHSRLQSAGPGAVGFPYLGWIYSARWYPPGA